MILLASLTLLSSFIASSNSMDRNTTEIVSTRLIVMNTEAPESTTMASTKAPESTTMISTEAPEILESITMTSTKAPEIPESTTLTSTSELSEKLTQQEASCSADICSKLCPRAYFTCDKTLTTCICKNTLKYTKLDESCSQIKSTNMTEWPPYADASEVAALYSTCTRITEQIILSEYYLPRLYLCNTTSSVNHGVCYFERAY